MYGFPWITFSLIFSGNEYFSFIYRNFGTLISSYIIIQLFCLPYLVLKNNFNKYQTKYFTYLALIPLLLILIFNYIKFDNEEIKVKKLNLEIFQLNLQNTFEQDNSSKNLDKILNYIKQSEAELIIFAENNYPFLINNLEINNIKNVLKKNQIVIIGGTRLENKNYYNSLLNISSENILHFDKEILVPFGEFLPLRRYLSFFNPISGQTDYSVGNKQRIINIKNKFNYIPVICYEILFYWKLIKEYNFRSNFIVNITNDIWFGKYLGPYQHFYLTKIRAAEFNKLIVRVSNNGISGIIDENGKILSIIDLNNSGSIKHLIALNNNNNLYMIHSFLKLYLLFISMLLILINFIKSYGKRQI